MENMQSPNEDPSQEINKDYLTSLILTARGALVGGAPEQQEEETDFSYAQRIGDLIAATSPSLYE